MNINFNQRYYTTEEKLKRALYSLLRIRGYNNISIKELCYEAGINRSSFYAHYQDINDLMINIEKELSKNIAQIFDPKERWDRNVFVKLFEFLLKNRDFYKAYLSSSEGAVMEKNDFMDFMNIINRHSLGGDISTKEKTYKMAFFAGGLKAIAKSWIMSGCEETPQQMAGILVDEYKQNAKYFGEE